MSTIISTLTCSIPMSILTSSPYSYTIGNLIVVRVSAHNANGWGPTSTLNTVGATACTVPTTMTAPTRGTSTTET